MVDIKKCVVRVVLEWMFIHQCSALSSLLHITVMDKATKEARKVVLWEAVQADCLLIIHDSLLIVYKSHVLQKHSLYRQSMFRHLLRSRRWRKTGLLLYTRPFIVGAEPGQVESSMSKSLDWCKLRHACGMSLSSLIRLCVQEKNARRMGISTVCMNADGVLPSLVPG